MKIFADLLIKKDRTAREDETLRKLALKLYAGADTSNIKSIRMGGTVISPTIGMKLFTPDGRPAVHLQPDADVFMGADLREENETAFHFFANEQTYNGEIFGEGDIMLGQNASGVENILWDESASTIKLRSGTTDILTWTATTLDINPAATFYIQSTDGDLYVKAQGSGHKLRLQAPSDGYISSLGLHHIGNSFSGTIAEMWVLVMGSRTGSNIYGVRNRTFAGDGQTLYMYNSWPTDTTDVGETVDAIYDFYVKEYSQSDGTVTNRYGLYVESLTQAGTGNYAIYTNAGTISLGDDITFRQAASIITSSGALTLNPATDVITADDVKLYSGADLIVYSDAGSTEKARIDGATGNVDIASTYTAATGGEQILKIVATDSVNQTSGILQTILVDHNITGAKSSTASSEGISVDMNLGSNINTAYAMASYISKSGNPNIDLVEGMNIYMEDMGSGTLTNLMGLDIGINSTNVASSRHCGMRIRNHSGTAKAAIQIESTFTTGIDLAGATTTQDIKLSDGSTLGGGATFQNPVIIDATNTESLLVRKNSDGGDVFVVDTTNTTVAVGGATDTEFAFKVHDSTVLAHTSNEADDHTLEIDADAAGFGDVKALDIDYITGAIDVGQDEGVILINIDETLAEGGDIFALEVLATDGDAGIYGLKAGVLVGPIHQDSGTFDDPTTGTNNTPSTDVDDMIDGSILTTTAIFDADNEYIIIGAAAAFQELELIFTTASSKNIKPTFWYSINGGSGNFTQFTPVDGTDGCSHSGVIAWDASDLDSHVADDTTGTFDIKIIRTRNTIPGDTPVLGYAKTAVTTEYIWDKEGNVNVANVYVPDGGTFGITGNELLTFNAAGYATFSGCFVGFGTPTPTTLVDVSSAAEHTKMSFNCYSADETELPYFTFRKSHSNVLGTLVATIDGEELGSIYWGGVDTAPTRRSSARIRIVQDGNATATRIPARMEFHTENAGVTLAAQMSIGSTGRVGIHPGGYAAPAAQLHVDQTSSTGAIPVLILDQADKDVVFIKLIGTSADGRADRSLVDVVDMPNAGALVGWFQIYVEDVQATNPITDGAYYVPFYAAPTA